MLPDSTQQVPIISISGTNGKTTVARLIATILQGAGRRVGLTTSDGIEVNGRLVEPGDWTGPDGAAAILNRGDIDVAVLETARGGILRRGVGYASNSASVLTNVSADHLDLEGIHTLAQLAATKATICRITRSDGWVVLNAEDPHVAAVAGLVDASVALFALDPDRCGTFLEHEERGGRSYALRRGGLVESEAGVTHEICTVDDIPIALGGLARHNVANALAAAGGARAMGASLAEVAAGLRAFVPTAEQLPGRLNFFRLGRRVVIVDFAHNEAGAAALLDVAQGIAARGASPGWPITAIVGTAGDRPSDALRAIGRIAGTRADRVAIKETTAYLRGRPRDWVIAELRAGLTGAGRDPEATPVYETEVAALRGELGYVAGTDRDRRPDTARVIALMCHAERVAVLALLDELGATPVSSPAGLRQLLSRRGPRRST
jgi:cyanophycin synthetase